MQIFLFFLFCFVFVTEQQLSYDWQNVRYMRCIQYAIEYSCVCTSEKGGWFTWKWTFCYHFLTFMSFFHLWDAKEDISVFLCPINEGWCGPLVFWTPFTFIICTNQVKRFSKYLLSCSKEEIKSCRFGMTWGWENDRFVIFGELSL